jgi:Histidine kinase-, DNA gyrase B-, and HSP90-like ATPase
MHNAQAAQQYLEHDKCDMHAVREILRDIVTDDERAAEVIERLRALLKEGEFQPEALAVDQLVQSVLKLLNHELKARSLSVVLNLSPGLRLIRGDRVQLQQVLINLILNAADAMQTTGPVRILTLGSNSTESEAIAISVSDTGDGILPGHEEKIFELHHQASRTRPRPVPESLDCPRSRGSHVGGESRFRIPYLAGTANRGSSHWPKVASSRSWGFEKPGSSPPRFGANGSAIGLKDERKCPFRCVHYVVRSGKAIPQAHFAWSSK